MENKSKNAQPKKVLSRNRNKNKNRTLQNRAKERELAKREKAMQFSKRSRRGGRRTFCGWRKFTC